MEKFDTCGMSGLFGCVGLVVIWLVLAGMVKYFILMIGPDMRFWSRACCHSR